MSARLPFAAAFDRAAEYDRDNPLLVVERPQTEALLPSLLGREVLDLGAGHGHYARWARAQGAGRVLAVDASLASCRRLGAGAVAAAAEALPLTSSTFDVVIASLVLSYVDRGRAFGEVARVLRPGGVFVASDLHAEGARRGGWRRGLKGADGNTIILEVAPPSPAVLLTELHAAGFSVDVIEETVVDARLKPHFERAGRRDFAALEGWPLLIHVSARRP
jgi:SAM-dependent methyltransferase